MALFVALLPLIIAIVVISFRSYLKQKRNDLRSQFGRTAGDSGKLVAFFHPYCNAGGGGERVLWQALKVLNEKYPQHSYIIYSDNYDAEPAEILRKAKSTFQINTEFQVYFVKLQFVALLSPSLYPVVTILLQNIGSMIVGFEALFKCPPDVLVDTSGASFIYPLFKLLSASKVVSYTHYPTVSTDMLNLVAGNVANYNNRAFIARNPLLSKLKLYYYTAFAFIYKMTGKCADVIMANSSWTRNHLVDIWNTPVTTVYPPCNTSNLTKLPLTNRDPNLIISMAQFRPEKNHKTQIEAFAGLLKRLRENGVNTTPKMNVIGSCRNDGDKKLVEDLKQLCVDLKVEQHVDFKVNLPYVDMEKLLGKASIAIHTMINEHFGISVVEFLASGLLTLTHNSAGPKLDIISEGETGFFAEDADSFADTLYRLVTLSAAEALSIRTKARASVDRFSERAFEEAFVRQVNGLL
ncbi:asparagine-linked glycosylation protein [Tyrophagus putrescentiae]|nr:asparagine-linked glycosylation protein [Tyrophagus putrescentiae]